MGGLEQEQHDKIINECLQGMKTSIRIQEDLDPGKGPYESAWFEKTISYIWSFNGSESEIELFYRDNYEVDPYYQIRIKDPFIDISYLNENNGYLIWRNHKFSHTLNEFFEFPTPLWAAILQLNNL